MILLYEFTIINIHGHVTDVKTISASHVTTPTKWIKDNTSDNTITQVKVLSLASDFSNIPNGKMFDTQVSDTQVYINQGGHIERFVHPNDTLKQMSACAS